MRLVRTLGFTLFVLTSLLGPFLFLVPEQVLAQSLPVLPGGVMPPVVPGGIITDRDLGLEVGAFTGLSNADPRLMVARIVKVFIGVLGVIFLVVVLIAGFTLMTSGGSSEKVDAAKQWLWGGVIGLVIILAAYAITNFIISQLVKATSAGHTIEINLTPR